MRRVKLALILPMLMAAVPAQANDVRAEAAFPMIVRDILGETGTPWRWIFGDMKFV